MKFLLESWLLCLICLPGVSWWLSGSSSRCHGVVCGLWLWYFLIIPTYYFCLRCHYVHAVLTTPILRSYCVLIQPRPHYAFVSMFKVRPRLSRPRRPYYDHTTSYKFLLRSCCVLQVHTASIQFFRDEVRTWLSARTQLSHDNVFPIYTFTCM